MIVSYFIKLPGLNYLTALRKILHKYKKEHSVLFIQKKVLIPRVRNIALFFYEH